MSGKIIDFTGKKFGYWTVLNLTSERKFVSGKARKTVWKCKCECGTIRNVSRSILLNEKKPRSCGCSRKIHAKEQFESHFERTEGCWIWQGNINVGGYGKFGSRSAASRLAYQYYKGEIPKGLQVCHSCDNRLCVNPDHLWLGTIGDNMRDKTEKNRQAKGSKIGSSILNEDQVLQIRKMRIAGHEYQSIADEFQIQWDLARKVCKNVVWKHVDLGQESKRVKQVRKFVQGSSSGMAKLDEDKVKQIKELLRQKKRTKDIANLYGINPSTVCDIKQFRTWKHVE